MKNSRLLQIIILVLGFGFLYLPIISLIVYSFNESRLVTVWGGFSTKWYGELLNNSQLLDAAWLSIKIGIINATIAVILGTLAAIVLVRYKRSKMRSSLDIMVAAPLVMPDVIIGLSILLLFVSLENMLGWPQRGQLTVILAHTTFSMAYVTVVVRSRLISMDRSLEEAAMDLGAKPLLVFLTVTLPIIAPSLAAGWLLSFTLSMDDLVIASFVSGPGATTLPMVVYSSVRLGVSPQINALASIIIFVVSIAVLVAGLMMHKQEKRLAAGG
ncbi:ABC transporter permease subunit [Neptuniibacter sp. CAU 1671]|uniref:ABC transporter permease subunit n=1 Tax=Neptuniibacter sp. CAU 1671 TaxID=3032593 RepID=UPI0023D99F7D|nr:ABC transporter permease subunit [Neptuniibacter sp. CAU 1671]MDF2182838.1 ABC transporter permease subunit [Neptuniibacter sp. CAU 1671]